MAPVLPRRYAVIGPGDTANTAYGAGANAGTTLLGELPSADVSDARRIEIVPDASPSTTQQVRVYDDGQNDRVEQLRSAGKILPPVGILIDQPRRLSISEPAAGYDDETGSYDWAAGYGTGVGPEPAEDLDRADNWGADDTTGDGNYNTWTGPLAEAGTTSAIRYVHLQRLANPLLPFNTATNPYITIDSSPVDLTVFDSASNASSHDLASPGTPAREYPLGDSLFTRQRGEEQSTLGDSIASFWRPLLVREPEAATSSLPKSRDATTLPVALDAAAAPHTHFDGSFNHSLGCLNEFYYYSVANDDRLVPATFGVSDTYRGAPGRMYKDASDEFQFESFPFPWLTWLNRPFANPMELLQVPGVSPTRLLFAYDNDDMSTAQSYAAGLEQFQHLMPFFSTISGTATNNAGKFYVYDYDGDVTTDTDPIAAVPAPHLYRLFEYVHVPSKFIDSSVDTTAGLISTYREPGKINLNTIYHHERLSSPPALQAEAVFRGLLADHAPSGLLVAWQDLLASRRGFHAAPDLNYFGFENGATPPLPTRIANPFRSFAGSQLVPRVPGRDSTVPHITENIIHEGVNAALLRALVGGNANYLESNFSDGLDTRSPLLTEENVTTAKHDNVEKNPYLKYQSIQRLSNLATTRSNVYAVWITLGYFEVERDNGFIPGNALHQQLYPDGYTLGQELGIDTGEVKRHRAFYIIDRSIPAGFIPGQDLNTDNTVLLRRFIE